MNPVIAGSTGALAVDALIVADAVHPAWDYEDPGGVRWWTEPRAGLAASPIHLPTQWRPR